MTEFTDSTGQTWTLILTLGSAKYIKDKSNINLLDPSSMVDDDNKMLRLFSDDLFVGDIIWNLIDKQADDRKLSQETVFSRFDGATISKAQEAFLKEYHAFFMARGNLQMAKMITETQTSVKKMWKEGLDEENSQSAGEILSNSPDVPESKTGETILGTN